MTFKTDLAAVVPTAAAKLAFQLRGHNIDALFNGLKMQSAEMSNTIKEILALHPLESVVSATINAAGSGGANGSVVLTGQTGTGTKFTAKGNIQSGALAGNLIITNGGSYSVLPTTPSAEPVSGGGLVGATVALTLSGDNAILTSLNAVLAQLA